LEENRDVAQEALMKYKPFFKTHKKVTKTTSEGYGIKTKPSDNIGDVMSYQYLRDIESYNKLKHDSNLTVKASIITRGHETKASMLRNEAIKNKLNQSWNPSEQKQAYKLRQFINIPSSDYIRNIKNRYKTQKSPPVLPQIRPTSTHSKLSSLLKSQILAHKPSDYGRNPQTHKHSDRRADNHETRSEGGSVGWRRSSKGSDYGSLRRSIKIENSVLKRGEKKTNRGE
jgi:hypothetical protein